MTGRKHKASGGVNEAAMDASHKNMDYTADSNVTKEAVKRKHGGGTKHRKHAGKHHEMHADGEHAKHHAGRKPRKSGGRLAGNEWAAAQTSTPAKGRNVSGTLPKEY